jgi:hypothetical protein
MRKRLLAVLVTVIVLQAVTILVLLGSRVVESRQNRAAVERIYQSMESELQESGD